MLRTAFLGLFCASVAFAGEKGNKAQAPAAPAPTVVKGKAQDAGKAQAPVASQVVITKAKKVEKTLSPLNASVFSSVPLRLSRLVLVQTASSNGVNNASPAFGFRAKSFFRL